MTEIPVRTYDAVIVGARAAGSALALHLARAGLNVVALDRSTFPSDILSTHVIYPNTIARLDQMGVLDAVLAHAPPPLYTAWHHEGRMFVAPHTPIEGRDWAICVRRITLDGILVEGARKAGAEIVEGMTVTGLIGKGTEDDPVRGVTALGETGEIGFAAPIVIGADGVNSTIARLVGAARKRIMPTETMLYFAYWTGVKTRNTQDFFFEPPWVCAHFPADDGHHVITMNGPLTARAEIKDWDEYYLNRIRSIPALWARLEGATKVSKVIGSPRLEGYYRDHTGPGWALVGDAAHFKHPAGAQGIGDAFHAAEMLAGMIADGSWRHAYPAWREQDSREFYAFCKHLGEPPGNDSMRQVMDTYIRDPKLARAIVDVWARTVKPWSDVIPHVPGLAAVTGASIDAVLAPYEGERVPLAASA